MSSHPQEAASFAAKKALRLLKTVGVVDDEALEPVERQRSPIHADAQHHEACDHGATSARAAANLKGGGPDVGLTSQQSSELAEAPELC